MPIELLKLLKGKDVLVGVIDVASDAVETPQEVADTIREALKYVPANRLFPCTNCGMAPMDRDIALAKLKALAAGAALARKKLGIRGQSPISATKPKRKQESTPTSSRGDRRRPRARR